MEDVSVHGFVDQAAEGVFQGLRYLWRRPLQNHVTGEHKVWVTTEVDALVQAGCVARWKHVADVDVHPRPHMVLPLGVEPRKPRLIWDARQLNLMYKHLPFTMDGVGKAAQCAWGRGSSRLTTKQGIPRSAGPGLVAIFQFRVGRRLFRVRRPLFQMVFSTSRVCLAVGGYSAIPPV